MDDDQQELMQYSDEDSLSDSEEPCLPIDKMEDTRRNTTIYTTHTATELFTTIFLLVLSSTALLILLPICMEALNGHGNVYGLILTDTGMVTLFFLTSLMVGGMVFKQITIWTRPLHLYRLVFLSIMYFGCILLIMYALDQMKVHCHLQDPIKGVILVFALLYYFFFCKKLMSLQRIFAAMTMIVGLFIAVDYGLCDEFRCRGRDRVQVSDDTGKWSWRVHAVWTALYLFGLAVFSVFFTILDGYLFMQKEVRSVEIASLTTVSRNVSYGEMMTNPVMVTTKKPSILHLLAWLHGLGFMVILGFFWTDLLPTVDKGANMEQFWNLTTNTFLCHFHSRMNCGNIATFSWLLIAFYIIFMVTSVKLLILTQSPVFTMGSMTMALPLVEIWWSLFHVVSMEDGFMVWTPTITGELICALLGFPIVLIGLILMCKSHFKDYQWSRSVTAPLITPNSLT